MLLLDLIVHPSISSNRIVGTVDPIRMIVTILGEVIAMTDKERVITVVTLADLHSMVETDRTVAPIIRVIGPMVTIVTRDRITTSGLKIKEVIRGLTMGLIGAQIGVKAETKARAEIKVKVKDHHRIRKRIVVRL